MSFIFYFLQLLKNRFFKDYAKFIEFVKFQTYYNLPNLAASIKPRVALLENLINIFPKFWGVSFSYHRLTKMIFTTDTASKFLNKKRIDIRIDFSKLLEIDYNTYKLTEKPKVKKSTVRSPIAKVPVEKKKPTIESLKPLNLEAEIYKKLTGKNLIYGGKITKAYENWKLKNHKDFQQKVGGKPYYKGNVTRKYEIYLKSL